MRIYRRDAFLALPPGTVYCKGEPWVFGGLQIKGGSLGNDWLYFDPQDIASHDSGQQVDRLEEMLASGASYPMNDAIERDGFYDPDDLFLVYEPADVAALIGRLLGLTSASVIP